MHLKVAVVNLTHFFEICEPKPGIYKGIGGVEFMLLKIVSYVLNFTYELIQPRDGVWGILKEDGNWSGIVGLLHRKEADMAVEMINLSYERLPVVDYSFPYNIDYSSFMIKKSGIAKKTFYFAHPFQLPVWGCIAVFLLLSSVVLTLLQCLKESHGRRTYVNFKNTFTAAETLIGNHAFGSLFNSCITTLFFVSSALPICILIFSFTGLLLSFLVKPIMEHQIKTVGELAEASRSDKVKVTALKGTNLEFALKKAEKGIMKDLSKNLRNNPSSIAVDAVHAVEKILDGHAYIDSITVMSVFALGTGTREKVFISNDIFQLTFNVILFKKKFCCANKFDRVILRLHESGIYQKLMRDLLHKLDAKAKFQASLESAVKPIEIESLFGVFGLLFCGCAAAMLALICEIWIKSLKKRKKSKRIKQSLKLRTRRV